MSRLRVPRMTPQSWLLPSGADFTGLLSAGYRGDCSQGMSRKKGQPMTECPVSILSVLKTEEPHSQLLSSVHAKPVPALPGFRVWTPEPLPSLPSCHRVTWAHCFTSPYLAVRDAKTNDNTYPSELRSLCGRCLTTAVYCNYRDCHCCSFVSTTPCAASSASSIILVRK